MYKTFNGITLTVVYRQGKLLDLRTAAYFDMLNKRMPGGVTIVQGSYSTRVGESAGTHAGPGALDLKPASLLRRNWSGYRLLEKLAREQGGAAWFRQWTGNWHVHLIVIGTPGLPRVSRDQVTAYYNGRDGLVSNGPMYGQPIRITWEQFLAKQSGGTTSSTNFLPPSATVKAMQATGRLTQDGIWGDKTNRVLGRIAATALKRMDYFGKQTESTRKEIQASIGANQTGIFDSHTKYRLKQTVIALQKAMGAVAVDGVWGAQSHNRYTYLKFKFFGYPFGPFPYPSGDNSRYAVPVSGKPYFGGGAAGSKLTQAQIQVNIKRVQKRVGAVIDGKFGPGTRDKVIAWQKARGIAADGIVGPQTWNAMRETRI